MTSPRDSTGPAGTTAPLDPRCNPYRPDLAAEKLRARVSAPNYATGNLCQVIRSSVPLRRQPDPVAALDTEALLGETVMVYDEAEGWAWGQLQRDGYVGYLPADALSADVAEPTHRVKVLGTFVFPADDIKSPPVAHLSINALLNIEEVGEKMCRISGGGYVPARHVAEKDRYVRDYVEVAERFIGIPYLWGGRTRLGIDCSGLVQIALEAAGIACPRDSDMQENGLGRALAIGSSLEGLERGDLVFWRGHVGIMCDGIMILHANAHHMAVTVETLPECVDRVARSGSELRGFKRLPRLGTQPKGASPPVR